MDERERLARLVAEHQMSNHGHWCIAKDCKFMASKVTDPNDRDFKRGWSTAVAGMRLRYGQHIADLFFRTSE